MINNNNCKTFQSNEVFNLYSPDHPTNFVTLQQSKSV